MNLKPEDVEQVKFRVALRGYAEDEVDIFLDQVTDTIRDLNRQLAVAQREAQEMREREALRLQRELLEAPPAAPAAPPPAPLPEEQPSLPVIPDPAPAPPEAEEAAAEENAGQVEQYDLPTQVIEPETEPPPAAEEEPPPERPQWGGYSY